MYPFSYSYDFYYGGGTTFLVIAILVAVILSVVLYFTFLNKKNEGKYTGAAEKIYNFFSFNKFYAEDILKLLYIISAAVFTVAGLAVLFTQSFVGGLLLILVGNVALRITYELVMMFIILCRKTVSLDKKMDKITDFFDGKILVYENHDDEPCEASGDKSGEPCESLSRGSGEAESEAASETEEKQAAEGKDAETEKQ